MMTSVKPLVLIFSVIILVSPVLAEDYNDQFISETAPLIAFTSARVIDGTGSDAKENHTVVIKDGRIVQMGRDGKVKIPKSAKRVSLKGKSLLPGWVMTNESLYYSDIPDLPPNILPLLLTQQSISYPRLYLSAGVTSALTIGSIQSNTDLGIKKLIDEGTFVGPEFNLTAPQVGAPPKIWFIAHPNNTDDIRTAIHHWANQGFYSIKVSSTLTQAQYIAAVDEAGKYGLKVMAKAGFSLSSHQKAIKYGVRFFTQVIASADDQSKRLDLNDPRINDLLQQYVDNDVVIGMTLAQWDPERKPDFVLNLLTDYSRRAYEQEPLGTKAWRAVIGDGAILRRQQALAFLLWQKGGTISVGTHSAWHGNIAGYGNLRSIELMAEAGIPLLDVIKIATYNGAEAIGILGDRGTLEVGKRADLIVINGDPSSNIKDIYNIETVFKKGIGYNPDALKESVKGTVGGPG